MKATEVRRLPKQVDALKLCQQSTVLDGYLVVGELTRLQEALSAPIHSEQRLPVSLHFKSDEQRLLVLRAHVHAQFSVICQRCLELMDYPVSAEFNCAFVASDEKAKQLPSHLEPILLEAESSMVALHDLLEDELLLNLPIAAFHEQCNQQQAPNASQEISDEVESKSPKREKPFSGLAELLSKQGLMKE